MKFRSSARTCVLGLILLLLMMCALFGSPKLHTHAATKAVDTKQPLEMVDPDLDVVSTAFNGRETSEKQQPVLYLRVISELVKTFYIA